MSENKTITKGTKTAGSKATEVIVGMAATKLGKAVAEITLAAKSIEDFEKAITEKTLKLSNLEESLKNAQENLKNTQAQNELDLKLSYKADRKKFVDEYLIENGLEAVPSNELLKLNDQLNSATKDRDTAIAKAVASATNELRREYDSKAAIELAENNAKQAELTAQLAQSSSQIKFMEQQVDSWKQALDAERAAGVERQKANAIGTLNLNKG